ncbi:MAG: hypothetical protein EBU49_12225, partial [Proteobacteria bacterium]|nr:hypothetical protein [Pseudomonadota bacterium]
RINPDVGLSALKRVGDHVERGEPLAEIHAQTVSDADAVANLVAGAFVVVDPTTTVPRENLVWKVLS